MIGLQENIIKRIFIAILVIVLLYGIYESRNLLGWFVFEIYEPTSSDVAENPVLLSGIAKKAENVTVNGRTIATQKDGTFKDVLYLGKGYNEVKIVATNKYGKSKEITLLLAYNGEEAEVSDDEDVAESETDKDDPENIEEVDTEAL